MLLYTVYVSLVVLVLVLSFLPRVSSQYWLFRVCDFGRIQLSVFQGVLLLVGFFLSKFPDFNIIFLQVLLLAALVENLYLLFPYMPKAQQKLKTTIPPNAKLISILSINVFQPNRQYQKLIDCIRDKNPDIFLTMESNADWQNALSVFDKDYRYKEKVPMENTYGMHFYSKLAIRDCNVNYFMADDVPSFKIELESANGQRFVFFGVHPPPPSPSEEPNSKERDGELIRVGEESKKCDSPVVVAGDFNNVAWSRSARLFKKISGLIDPRIGRGFYPTYHAKYWWFRFPIDLFFHSKEIIIHEFEVLPTVGSDHLPLYCSFYIENNNYKNAEANTESITESEKKEAEEMKVEGKQEEGER